MLPAQSHRLEADPAQERALAAIQQLGGKVERDRQWPGRPVVGVDLSSSNAEDAGLVHLKGLPELRGVSLYSTKVTDAGRKTLAGFPRLEWANLRNTAVTMPAVEELEKARPGREAVKPG